MTDQEKVIIRNRAKQHHAEGGKVLMALDKVFATVYPAGTNLVLRWLDLLIGIPYGHVNWTMDKVTDCEELWRNVMYIWFGIDIGNFSDAAYESKLGTTVTKDFSKLPTLRPLTLCFYHMSSTKVTGHVTGIYDAKHIYQSGASIIGKKTGLTSITYGKKEFMCAKNFLTDAQYASVIVPESVPVTPADPTTPVTPTPTPKYAMTRILSKGDKGEDVFMLETRLEALGFSCNMTKAERKNHYGTFGSGCFKAVTDWQKKHLDCGTNGKPDGEIGQKSAIALGFDWKPKK